MIDYNNIDKYSRGLFKGHVACFDGQHKSGIVLFHFVDDEAMRGSCSEKEWLNAVNDLNATLGKNTNLTPTLENKMNKSRDGPT